jgi:hypothetical protein
MMATCIELHNFKGHCVVIFGRGAAMGGGGFIRNGFVLLIGRDPSVPKTNRLHVDIFRISFIKLTNIL